MVAPGIIEETERRAKRAKKKTCNPQKVIDGNNTVDATAASASLLFQRVCALAGAAPRWRAAYRLVYRR